MQGLEPCKGQYSKIVTYKEPSSHVASGAFVKERGRGGVRGERDTMLEK